MKVPGVRNLEFDTTGMGYFKAASGKFKPDAKLFNAALEKKRLKRVKVTSLQKVDLPKAVAGLELTVAGLG